MWSNTTRNEDTVETGPSIKRPSLLLSGGCDHGKKFNGIPGLERHGLVSSVQYYYQVEWIILNILLTRIDLPITMVQILTLDIDISLQGIYVLSFQDGLNLYIFLTKQQGTIDSRDNRTFKYSYLVIYEPSSFPIKKTRKMIFSPTNLVWECKG